MTRFSPSGVTAVDKRWIWPFELLDKLGEGGMGVVYRARYVVDNRHVAVKLLPPDIANETILSRFERELEILKTLLWGFHNNDTGQCFPSYETIAKRARCNRDTVYEALKVFEEADIL